MVIILCGRTMKTAGLHSCGLLEPRSLSQKQQPNNKEFPAANTPHHEKRQNRRMRRFYRGVVRVA
jgi:hypothetical protein